MIRSTNSKTHWNYFISLEKDLEVISRYIEFTEQNFAVYSIALAQLLFASASEVDVIAKLLCKLIDRTAKPRNIDQYRPILLSKIPDIPDTCIFIPRYGLTLTPWANWKRDAINPFWWTDYNQVKHQRDMYFNKATLKNSLNALGALLIFVFNYYRFILALPGHDKLSLKETTRQLDPDSNLLRLPEDHYTVNLILE